MTTRAGDNPFEQPRGGATGQILDRVPVTPSDTVGLPESDEFVGIGIQVTGAGTVSWVTWNDETRSWDFDAKEQIVCSVKQVLATGTDATGIIVMRGH